MSDPRNHAGFRVATWVVWPTHEYIGVWELMNQAQFVIALEPTIETDPEAVAAAVFAKYDRNGDGYLCVMTQVVPNHASGSDTWLVYRDNVANASK